MSKRNHPRSGGLAVRILGSLAVLAVLVVVMYLALPKETGPLRDQADLKPKIDDKARRCDVQLADLMEAMTPGRLGISSDRAQVIDRLNTWRTECAAQSGQVQPSTDQSLIESLFTGDALAQTLSDRFIAEDASHIRMSLLARDIATSLVEGNTSSVDRAVTLFDFVCRNVMLINEDIRKETELTAYECLIFGLGTAEDRAWIFAELMRQLRTDVVILTPKAEGKQGDWLIGVIDPAAGIMLFDPRLGLPIPAADSPTDTPYPRVPATLQAVLESDAAFRSLDLADSPYPLTSTEMKELQVSLIGSSSSWAPRMALLQFLLPQGVSVDLYDGLGKNELRSPGLLERVVQAGKDGLWTSENVSVWEAPEAAEQRFESTRGEGEQNSQLFNFHVIFRGPYVPRSTGADGKTIVPTPIAKSLHFVRIELLKGKYSEAIKDFLPVRTTVSQYPSPANEAAAEFATLWTGVAQYRTNKIRTAIGTIDRYVTTQARSAGLMRTAVEYLADCMIAQKSYALAADVLQKAPEGFAPRRDTFLIRRWKKLAGIDPDAPVASPSAPAEKPAGEPADEKKPTEGDAKGEMKAPAATPAGEAEAASPTESKPETPKPATEDKPAEEKPADGKPAETPSADDKPAEEKPAGDTPEPALETPAPQAE